MLGLSSNATIMVPPAIHCTRPETRTDISCAALTATRSVPVRAQAVSSARSALLSSRRFIRILLVSGHPILSHRGAAMESHPVRRDRIPSSFSLSPEILREHTTLQEVTSGGTEESGDRHP